MYNILTDLVFDVCNEWCVGNLKSLYQFVTVDDENDLYKSMQKNESLMMALSLSFIKFNKLPTINNGNCDIELSYNYSHNMFHLTA